MMDLAGTEQSFFIPSRSRSQSQITEFNIFQESVTLNLINWICVVGSDRIRTATRFG